MGKSKSKSKSKSVSGSVFDGRLRVQIDDVKGRSLVTQVPISAGQLVLSEKPVAVVLATEDPLATASASPCTPARLQEIADQYSCSFELLVMVVKLHMWQQSTQQAKVEGEEGGDAVADLPLYRKEGAWLCATVQGLAALEDHLDKQAAGWVGSLTDASHALAGLLPGSPTPASLLSLAAKINVNSYGILSPSGSSLGFCMLPAVGLLVNHSCDPNCLYYFDFEDGTMKYRAVRGIAAGEEVTVAYIDTVMSTTARGLALLSTKHFRCACARCQANQVAVQRSLEGHSLDLLSHLELDLDLNSTSSSSSSSGGGQMNKNKKLPPTGVSVPPPVSSALLLADAYLDGLYCHACGSSGVVLDHGCCLLCCAKAAPAAEVALAKATAEGSGSVAVKAAKSTPTTTVRVALEQWLAQYDPGFALLAESFKVRTAASAPPVNKKRRPLQLHPCHALLLDALTALASLLLHQGDVRGSTACIRRSLRVMSPLLPACHPEILALQMHLADALGTGSREAEDLKARCAAGRALLHGVTPIAATAL